MQLNSVRGDEGPDTEERIRLLDNKLKYLNEKERFSNERLNLSDIYHSARPVVKNRILLARFIM